MENNSSDSENDIPIVECIGGRKSRSKVKAPKTPWKRNIKEARIACSQMCKSIQRPWEERNAGHQKT
ncbi:hypothetical protein C0J52_05429 [Blattella germanica]|nr:hypothetical protein C0J52_05429 [Blattella germanica]